MLIDIDKIIVKDRIRKDFGDIKELAEDIKVNGLINPPVVNKNYELLAGERRLRACKSLGWKQIEIHMMDTRDAEHELEIEISENEVRKEFSRAERIDYAKRLERIERAKAEERRGATLKQNATDVENFPQREDPGKTRDIVAAKMGIGSGKQYEKEKFVADNREALPPADFADWDEGKLSTNKAFQKVKAALAEKEERIKELEAGENLPGMREAYYKNRIKTLEAQGDELKKNVVKLEGENWSLEHDLTELRASLPDGDEDPATEAAIKKKALEFAKADLDSMAKKYDGLIDFAEFLTEYAKSISK